jgi:potassium-transporting ATPase KdpC subunit
MKKTLFSEFIWPSIILLFLLTVLLGLIYPMLVTAILQLTFHHQANGSLIYQNDRLVGSALIGQPFNQDQYFWSRPSATTPPYNSAESGGANLCSANPQLIALIHARADKVPAEANSFIPIDMLTSSGSGLDPHISVRAAKYQLPRVAKARNMSENDLLLLLTDLIEHRQWGIFGIPRINVVKLNLKLDEINIKSHGTNTTQP